MLLSQGKPKTKYKIQAINGDLLTKRRLFDLGFLPDETIEILNISPLKKTYLLNIKGYVIAIRKNLADNIEIVGNQR